MDIQLDRRTFEQELLGHFDDRKDASKLCRKVGNVAELTEKEIADVLSVLTDAAQEYILISKPGRMARALPNLPYSVAPSDAIWDSWSIGKHRSCEV